MLSSTLSRFLHDHRTIRHRIRTLRDRFHTLTSDDLAHGRLLRDAIASLREYGGVIGGSGINERGWVAQQAHERTTWLAGKGMEGRMRVGKRVIVEDGEKGVWTWLNLLKLGKARDEL